jgi:hypothetical protein
MTGTPARNSACDLGSTGQQVRAAFTALNAPSSFRESLLQRLVLEGDSRGQGASGSAARRPEVGIERAPRGVRRDMSARE